VYNARPMRTLALMSLVFGCVLAACGGDDGGSSIDAPPAVDAAPDAPAAKQLGSACTPDQANPPGDCGAGFICLPRPSAMTTGFCTKTCTQGAGDTCAQGYTGPGKAQCVLGVQSGQQVILMCGVICSASSEQICPAATCNGTCPTPLQCTGAIQNQQMQTVAMACQ